MPTLRVKTCNKCGKRKKVDEFRVKRNKCRACEIEYTKEWREKPYRKLSVNKTKLKDVFLGY